MKALRTSIIVIGAVALIASTAGAFALAGAIGTTASSTALAGAVPGFLGVTASTWTAIAAVAAIASASMAPRTISNTFGASP